MKFIFASRRLVIMFPILGFHSSSLCLWHRAENLVSEPIAWRCALCADDRYGRRYFGVHCGVQQFQLFQTTYWLEPRIKLYINAYISSITSPSISNGADAADRAFTGLGMRGPALHCGQPC